MEEVVLGAVAAATVALIVLDIVQRRREQKLRRAALRRLIDQNNPILRERGYILDLDKDDRVIHIRSEQ